MWCSQALLISVDLERHSVRRVGGAEGAGETKSAPTRRTIFCRLFSFRAVADKHLTQVKALKPG